jgi:hypothetical protein
MSEKLKAWNKPIHPKTNAQDFRTPAYLIHFLKERFGSNFVDAAFNPNEDNATSKTFDLWGAEAPDSWIYINPPWDTPNVIKFVAQARKWANQGYRVVFLLPVKLTERKWVDQVNPHLDHIIILGGRINFEGPNTVKAGTTRWGCFFGIMDETANYSSIKTFESLTLADLKRNYAACL